MDNRTTEKTITAPTLNKLLDRIEAATPLGMVAITKLMMRIDSDEWKVSVRFKKEYLK